MRKVREKKKVISEMAGEQNWIQKGKSKVLLFWQILITLLNGCFFFVILGVECFCGVGCCAIRSRACKNGSLKKRHK